MDNDELNRDRFKCCGLAAANRDTNQLNNRDLEKQPNHLGRFVPADEPRIAGWPDGDTSRFVPADVAGMESPPGDLPLHGRMEAGGRAALASPLRAPGRRCSPRIEPGAVDGDLDVQLRNKVT